MQWKLPLCIFWYIMQFLSYKGPKGAEECHFVPSRKFLFFIRFWWGFFYWIPLKERWDRYPSDFSYFLPFPRKIRPKLANNSIFQKFLFLIRFRWGLLQMIPCKKCNESCPYAFFCISCRFLIPRGWKVSFCTE